MLLCTFLSILNGRTGNAEVVGKADVGQFADADKPDERRHFGCDCRCLAQLVNWRECFHITYHQEHSSQHDLQDPTTIDPNWVAVDLKPIKALPKPVTLAQVKAESALKDMDLVRLSRLSVGAVKKREFERVMVMAGVNAG